MIDFKDIPESEIPHFLDGEGNFNVKMFNDGLNRIMKGLLKPGCSIGYHQHETSSEIIFIIQGSPKFILDGVTERLHPGDCHYCKKGSSHTFINDTEEDIVFYVVVPNQ